MMNKMLIPRASCSARRRLKWDVRVEFDVGAVLISTCECVCVCEVFEASVRPFVGCVS